MTPQLASVLFALAALFVIWKFILGKEHKKEVVQATSFIVSFIKYGFVVVVGLFVLYKFWEWSYKLDHTVFIGDPNKSIFNQ